MKASQRDLLIYIGAEGGIFAPVKLRTTQLSKKLNISQQTISRWLIELEKSGMLFRNKEGILLAPPAEKYLEEIFAQLNLAFKKSSTSLLLSGKVIAGMREAKYYLSQPEYKKQIKDAIGFNVFPGTLNILLDKKSIYHFASLRNLEGIKIAGFSKNNRTFGEAKLFPAKFGGLKCALILPFRSHYGINVAELIAPFNLRKKKRLKNGAPVDFRVLLNYE